MNFWLRNIIISIVLIIIASVLLLNQDFLDEMDEQWASSDTPSEVEMVEQKTAIDTVAVKTTTKSKSSNAAAEGLSRFYANLHGDSNDKGPKIRNNVVFLPEPKGDLIEILEAKRLTTRPLRSNWKGSTESRPFRKGQTLFQKLSEFADQDGLSVVWWINRDFLVKDPFRIEKDIVQTAFQIVTGISGHFHHGASTFFCYQQRALVIIENEKYFRANDYLNTECTLVESSSGY